MADSPNRATRLRWKRLLAAERLSLRDATWSGPYLAAVRRDPCYLCGDPSQELDHIVPVAEGGETGWTNYAGICKSCNRSKWCHSLLVSLLLKCVTDEQIVLDHERETLLACVGYRGGGRLQGSRTRSQRLAVMTSRRAARAR